MKYTGAGGCDGERMWRAGQLSTLVSAFWIRRVASWPWAVAVSAALAVCAYLGLMAVAPAAGGAAIFHAPMFALYGASLLKYLCRG